MDLSVIIPAYNEEKRISGTLETVYAYLQAQSLAWEIVVVLDGSKDDTAAVVTRFREEMAADDQHQLHIINRTENRGKGYTVREGMLHANGANSAVHRCRQLDRYYPFRPDETVV